MAFTIEVNSVPTRLVDVRGESFEGRIFLHTVSDHDYQPETVRDRLNDPNTEFVPVEIDGKVDLVHLANVAYFEVLGDLAEIDELKSVGAKMAAASLLLTTGEELTGTLVYAARPGGGRVLDLLNSRDGRFVVLLDEQRVLFVSRDSILRARV